MRLRRLRGNTRAALARVAARRPRPSCRCARKTETRARRRSARGSARQRTAVAPRPPRRPRGPIGRPALRGLVRPRLSHHDVACSTRPRLRPRPLAARRRRAPSEPSPGPSCAGRAGSGPRRRCRDGRANARGGGACDVNNVVTCTFSGRRRFCERPSFFARGVRRARTVWMPVLSAASKCRCCGQP